MYQVGGARSARVWFRKKMLFSYFSPILFIYIFTCGNVSNILSTHRCSPDRHSFCSNITYHGYNLYWRSYFWKALNETSLLTFTVLNIYKQFQINLKQYTTFLLKYLKTPVNISITELQKKIPTINIQHSVSFSPAEYDFGSHFFPSRHYFRIYYDKGQKINIIGCIYVMSMLKLTNNFNVLHTWDVSIGTLFYLMYIFKLTIVPFQKKLKNKFSIM